MFKSRGRVDVGWNLLPLGRWFDPWDSSANSTWSVLLVVWKGDARGLSDSLRHLFVTHCFLMILSFLTWHAPFVDSSNDAGKVGMTRWHLSWSYPAACCTVLGVQSGFSIHGKFQKKHRHLGNALNENKTNQRTSTTDSNVLKHLYQQNSPSNPNEWS